MRAVRTPPVDRPSPTTTWLMAAAIVAAAGTVVAFAPPDAGRPEPGDRVNYSEDRVGRPWRVIREHEFGRYVIRNGRVTAIADVDEITPYRGVAPDITEQMVGQYWKDKLPVLKGQRQVAIQD